MAVLATTATVPAALALSGGRAPRANCTSVIVPGFMGGETHTRCVPPP